MITCYRLKVEEMERTQDVADWRQLDRDGW